MLKKLRKVNMKVWHYDDDGNYVESIHARISGDVSGLSGDVGWLRGDVSGLRGNVSWLRGDVNDCEISQKERDKGVNIADLLAEAIGGDEK